MHQAEAAVADSLDLTRAGTIDGDAVLTALGTSDAGLSDFEVARRLTAFGPNAVRTHHAHAWTVLERQLRSPLLLLLLEISHRRLDVQQAAPTSLPRSASLNFKSQQIGPCEAR